MHPKNIEYFVTEKFKTRQRHATNHGWHFELGTENKSVIGQQEWRRIPKDN